MPKAIKIAIVAVIAVAILFAINPLGWNMPWNKAETAISNPPKSDPQLAQEKAAREKAEADLKAKEKQIAEMQEKINQMKQDEADAAQNPPANQIATPVPANPADTATVVIPVKKKSGVGG